MAAVGGLGSLMSSTAVVAIFIPVVLRISQNRGTAPSRLMMPLSFAALISGMLTLVATAPNLVVNAELDPPGRGRDFASSASPRSGCRCSSSASSICCSRAACCAAGAAAAAAARRPACAMDRAIPARRSRTARPRRRRIAARGQAPRGLVAARRRREPSRHRTRPTRFGTEVLRPSAQTELQAGDVLLVDVLATDGEMAALRQKSQARLRAARRRAETTSSTVRRRSAWWRSSCRPNPS